MFHLALAGLTALWAAPIQEKFNENKHPWTRWKVGATAKYKISGEVQGNKVEGEMTQSLSAKGDTEYTTLHKHSIMGFDSEETETESIPVADGSETLTVDGKKYECTIWKGKGKKGDKATETRVWVPKGGDIPLKLVAGGEDSAEFVAEKTGVKVTAGDGKEYSCVLLRGKMKSQGADVAVAMYFSEKVPGGIVKMEMKVGDQGTLAYELGSWSDGGGKKP